MNLYNLLSIEKLCNYNGKSYLIDFKIFKLNNSIIKVLYIMKTFCKYSRYNTIQNVGNKNALRRKVYKKYKYKILIQ